MLEIIGIGSYGCVSKAKCISTGKIVALKVLSDQLHTEYGFIKLLREIQILKKIT
jgi:serine/threonine protein kinase